LPPLGLFGGTFDPPHQGHLFAASFALKRLGLGKVLFIPSGRPPHKPPGEVAPARERLRMVSLALKPFPRFAVSRAETGRRGVSFTVDTVRLLRRRHPGRELFFIIGADTARQLSTWKEHRKLLRLVRFAVIARPGVPLRGLPPGGRFTLLRTRGLPFSSHGIRTRIARGGRAVPGLPPAVARYIRARGLYREDG
jgi:nicotinate-nucleotide adenylyltransferase